MKMQKLLLKPQEKAMLANGRWNATKSARDGETDDFRPVVKLFCPWNACTWLLTELDPNDQDIAFGLCDVGQGSPEIGSVRLSEIRATRGPGGLYIERDKWFRPAKTLSAYAAEARIRGHIAA